MLPSEHQLAAKFSCSRNTARRAISQLAQEGYVQSIHGKGVLVLYQKPPKTEFTIGGVESLKEAARRIGFSLRTKVIHFELLNVTRQLSDLTGFPLESRVYYVQRVRYLNEEALILDHNYFLSDIVRNLTPHISEQSVYEYMEDTLGEVITATHRKYTIEPMTELDSRYLDMHGFNCLMVVNNRTFNREGIMFEYTNSRHRPDRFVFYELARRKKLL